MVRCIRVGEAVGREKVFPLFYPPVIGDIGRHLRAGEFPARLLGPLGDLDLGHTAEGHHLRVALLVEIPMFVTYTVQARTYLEDHIRQGFGDLFGKGAQRCFPVDTEKNLRILAVNIGIFRPFVQQYLAIRFDRVGTVDESVYQIENRICQRRTFDDLEVLRVVTRFGIERIEVVRGQPAFTGIQCIS